MSIGPVVFIILAFIGCSFFSFLFGIEIGVVTGIDMGKEERDQEIYKLLKGQKNKGIGPALYVRDRQWTVFLKEDWR